MPLHFKFIRSRLSPSDINSPSECRDLLLLSPRILRLVHGVSPRCQSSASNTHTRNVSAKTSSRMDKSKGVVGPLWRDRRNGGRKRGGRRSLQLTSARERLSHYRSHQSKYVLSDSSRGGANRNLLEERLTYRSSGPRGRREQIIAGSRCPSARSHRYTDIQKGLSAQKWPPSDLRSSTFRLDSGSDRFNIEDKARQLPKAGRPKAERSGCIGFASFECPPITAHTVAQIHRW